MSDLSVEKITSVVGSIYEAAYDQERWLDVVTGMRDLLGGSRACITRLDREVQAAVSTIPDRELQSPEALQAHLRDPLAVGSLAKPIGAIYRRTDVAGADFQRREFWNDWFRPRDMYDGLVCNLVVSDSSLWFLDVHRGATQAAFDAAEIGLMQKLVPHVIRAGEIGRNFEKTSALASAFSHLPFGIMLVDGHQRVGHMNAAAEAVLARPDSPLRLKSGLVAAAQQKDEMELQRLVAAVCLLPDGALPGLGGTMLISSGSQKQGSARLVLSVAPFLNARAYGLASERCAVIMIRELSPQNLDGFDDHIRIVFDLTRSEARVATALASGRSLTEAALQAGITVKTARTYLERIFRKTGASHQGQLVALLNSAQPLHSLR